MTKKDNFERSVIMSRHAPAWLVAIVFLLAVFATAEGQITPSPLTVLKEMEWQYREAKGDVALGDIMAVTYPANIVEADERCYARLIELAEALKTPERRHYRIVLKGYADTSGYLPANQRLSLQRAESLKQLLVHHPSMAISEDRITVEGHGEKNPVAPGTTREERRQNRRVEIHLIGNVAAAVALQAEQRQAEQEIVRSKSAPQAENIQDIVSSSATSSEGPSTGEAEPAAVPEAVRLSLLEAIQRGLEGNQDIRVVSFTPMQAEEDLTDAEAVYDPEFFVDGRFRRDPNLQSSVTRIVMEDDGLLQAGIRKPLSTGGSLSGSLAARYSDLNNAGFDRTYRYIFAPTVEIRQPLLKNIGAKEEKTAIKIANYQLNISEEEFRQKAIDISARISRAYWQLYLLREFVRIDRENFEMAEEVYRRERVRVTEGISQSIDVERARSNAKSRQGNLLQSRQRLGIATDQLKLLMNWSNLTIDSDVAILPTEAPQTAPIEVHEKEAIERALLNRPETKQAGQRLEISKAEESLYRHRRLPALDVFGRYAVSGYADEFSDAYDDTSFNDEDSWAVGLNFSYPIGNRSAEARFRSKAIARQQSEAQIERIQSHIKQEVKQVLLSIAFAEGEIESTRVAKESALKVVQGEFIRFEIGQTTNEELLRAQDLLAANSRNYVRAVVDYNIAKAELTRAQGLLPEGITVEAGKD
jgi:outer membrane protein TolC/outer membrane protein OmpA-like peptidoglycan-associated protein